MNFSKSQPQGQVGFQMAPMIDMMFILLINFMAMTIFAQWENKLGIQVPTADSGVQSSRARGELIINVDEQGGIFVNSQPLSEERLLSLLCQISGEFRTQPVIIRADRHSQHQDVVKVLDICRQADIWNVAFSTLPKEE